MIFQQRLKYRAVAFFYGLDLLHLPLWGTIFFTQAWTPCRPPEGCQEIKVIHQGVWYQRRSASEKGRQ